MQLVEGQKVRELTGLTHDQLREWTGRRGIVCPDLPARRKGTPAKFSWQTVLVLKLCMVLRNDFRIELAAHRALLKEICDLLRKSPFHALRGHRLALLRMQQCILVSPGQTVEHNDALVLDLERHLEFIATSFGYKPAVTQLPLFPAIGLKS